MLLSSRYSDYDQFAWFYDSYWGEVFTNRYFDVVERAFLAHIKRNSNILDLCCGSGQLAHAMSEAGYRVSGIDGSAGLIRIAKKNAPKADFTTRDARSFTIIDKFEGVICTYDSLNHVMDLVSLANVFNNVYSALKKGGLFMFDVTLEEGFRERWKGSASVVEKDHVLATSASYDPEKREARIDLTTFVREKHWNRNDATIVEHCFTRDELVNRLSKSLFRDIKTADSHRDFGKEEVGRTFFTCTK